MPIEHWGKGGTTVTGDAIDFLRLAAQRGAVKLEIAGLKVVRRGPALWKALREHYQIPGKGKRQANKHDVLAWLEAKVAELRPQQTHISKDEATGRTVVEVEGKEVN